MSSFYYDHTNNRYILIQEYWKMLLYHSDFQEFVDNQNDIRRRFEELHIPINSNLCIFDKNRDRTPIELILDLIQSSASEDQFLFEKGADLIRLLYTYCGSPTTSSPSKVKSPLFSTFLHPPQYNDCMQVLLECGARFNESDTRRFPLHFIARGGDPYLGKLLLLAAYNQDRLHLVDTPTIDGTIALHKCVSDQENILNPSPDIAIILIKYFGSDPEHADSKGKRAVDFLPNLIAANQDYYRWRFSMNAPRMPLLSYEEWCMKVARMREILMECVKFHALAMSVLLPYTTPLLVEERRGHVSLLTPELIKMIFQEHTLFNAFDSRIKDLRR
jgi:hypothetical protein